MLLADISADSIANISAETISAKKLAISQAINFG
jgi:hypothetical protein